MINPSFVSNYLMKVSMPLWLRTAKKETGKRYHINLNNYHTWHHSQRNKLKQAYSELAKEKFDPSIRGLKNINLVFVMHRGDKRKVDRANVLCLHEKFFCDALVGGGVLKDDNDSFINSTHYLTGEIDRENPRVDIYLTRLQ